MYFLPPAVKFKTSFQVCAPAAETLSAIRYPRVAAVTAPGHHHQKCVVRIHATQALAARKFVPRRSRAGWQWLELLALIVD